MTQQYKPFQDDVLEFVKKEIRQTCADMKTKTVEIERLTKQRNMLLEAAKNLRDVKGRYHTEVAMNRLIDTIKQVESKR